MPYSQQYLVLGLVGLADVMQNLVHIGDRYLFLSSCIYLCHTSTVLVTSHSDHERSVPCVVDYVGDVMFNYIEHASSLVKQITAVWPNR